MPGGRMHDQPLGFVYDDKGIVLINNVERDIFGA
jgi:hypothetical protein